jgi:hypothetical protein
MPLTSALVSAALIGATLMPGAEAAPNALNAVAATAVTADGGSDGDEVHATYTRRFTVTNMSSKRLELLSIEGASHEDGHSAIGTVVAPAQSTAFEVTWLYLQRHEIRATFGMLDANGARTGTATATMTLASEWVGPVPSSSATVTGGGTALADRYQITVLDAPGTVINLPDTDPVAQGATLSALCANSSAVRCSFAATGKPELVLGPKQVVGTPVNNTTAREQSTSLGGTDTVTTSHSVEISASATATVMKLVELTLSTTYGYSSSVTHEFTQTVDVTVAPKTRAWLEAQEPMIRTTGDFTITAGNTTWTVRGVQFLTPDTTTDAGGKYRPGELWIRDQPLSDSGQPTGPVTTRKIDAAQVASLIPVP